MDRRSRRKNMSILPPIEENGAAKGSSRNRWRVTLMAVASCCAGYTYNANPRRRLSTTRPALRTIPKHTLLFDDGTLFTPEGAGHLCDYFAHSKRLHTEIERLHLYLHSCQDSPEQLDTYFEALLLANAAQVPFTMTCGGALENSLISRLVVDNDFPGPRPMEGRSWTASDVCRTDNANVRLGLMADTIRQTFEEAVPKTSVDDIVLQFDPTVPMSTYTQLIVEARFEGGTIESIAIVGKGPHLLIQHLGRTFPEMAIEMIEDEEGDLLHLYSRLMYARVAGVCSVPSLCGLAMLSGVGGFLHQEGCPEWISSAAREASSKVELFKVAGSRIV